MQTSNHPLSMDQTAATSGNISRGAERCCISNLRNLSMKPLGPGKHSWKVLQTTWNMWLERPPGRWCFSSQTLGRYLPAVPRNCYICQLLLPGFPGFPDESLWITGEVVSNCRHSICSSGFTKNHSNNKKSRRMTCHMKFTKNDMFSQIPTRSQPGIAKLHIGATFWRWPLHSWVHCWARDTAKNDPRLNEMLQFIGLV